MAGGGRDSQANSREIHPRQEELRVKALNGRDSGEELKAVLTAGAQHSGEDMAGATGVAIGGGQERHTCKDCIGILAESLHSLSQPSCPLSLDPGRPCLENWALGWQNRAPGQLPQ